MVDVAVNHRVLRWARDECQWSQSTAAQELGLGVADLSALEKGDTKPSLGVLRKMAAKYGVSLATLAMPEPPAPTKRPADFRTIDGRDERITRATALAIRQARHYQIQLQDVLAEEEDLAVRFSVPDAGTNQTAKNLAARERKRLGISVGDQLSWKTDNQAFRVWRDTLEKFGVFVFVLDFPREDCQGFSLREAKNPVIGISKHAANDAAKTFTLVHEYGHVLLNKPGISDFNNGNGVERYCNEFAAELLMPEEALRQVLDLPNPPKRQKWDFADIRRASGRLHVSQQALALRLTNAGYAYGNIFDALRAIQQKVTQRASAGAVPPVIKRLSEVGVVYANATLTSYERGNMSDLEAYRMLKLSPKHFDDLRARLSTRLPIHGEHRTVP